MTAPTLNTQLLTQTLEYIEAHPDQLNMDWWRCGTQRCFAGWASYLAGGRFISSEDNNTPIATSHSEHTFRSSVVRTNTGELMHVMDHAARELGLTSDDAETLFHGDNTLDTLRKMVHNLIEWGRVDDPCEHPDPVPVGRIVWEEGCRTLGCTNSVDDGEGYDGWCGSCADQQDSEPDPDVAHDIAVDRELGVG